MQAHELELGNSGDYLGSLTKKIPHFQMEMEKIVFHKFL